MSEFIDIEAIPNSPRYVYTVDYIFPNQYQSASAFLKKEGDAGFHIQEFYEICIISRGEGYHVVEDTAVIAKKGDVFIVTPGKRHTIRGGKNINVHYIHLSPKFFEQYLDKMIELPTFLNLFEIEPMMRIKGDTYRHLYLDEASLKEVTDIIEYISEMWQYDHASKLIVEGYTIVMLTILCREYEKLQTKIGKNVHKDKFFMDSISYIIKNYSKRLTIEELANQAKLSRTAYIKRFRETTGKSPKQFITHMRIVAAKRMLATNLSISKISEECGFYDAAHFIKTFAAVTGISPTAYKNTRTNEHVKQNAFID